VPDERLAEVAEQYHLFGGRSPINDHCRALIDALEEELAEHGPKLPIYWGNRNWHPFLADTVARMADDGIERAVVFATSAFSSYSGCRQYREDLEQARDQVGSRAPELHKLRLFYNHPGFVEPLAANLAHSLGADETDRRVVFTAHSIPVSMAATSEYQSQLTEAAELVLTAAGFAGRDHDLVFQSRSGPPQVPWLEPDINDHLEALAEAGTSKVAVVPIGFVSDHMEVLFDLDTQAAETAARVGIDLVRVPTVGTAPRFVSMIRELIDERVAATPRLSLGCQGPWPDQCPEGHCIPAARPGRPGGAR
jgi:ferrochelatase